LEHQLEPEREQVEPWMALEHQLVERWELVEASWIVLMHLPLEQTC